MSQFQNTESNQGRALVLDSFALTQNTTSSGVAQLNTSEQSYINGIYLRIDGIPGESQHERHEDWIEILSFNWSEANNAVSRAGGNRAGKVVSEAFHFVKMYDKSSPMLFLYCASGKHIKSVDLEVIRPLDGENEGVFIEYNFEDVVITFYQTSGDINRSPGVLDEFSLDFAKLRIRYTIFDQGLPWGQTVVSWDFVANRGT